MEVSSTDIEASSGTGNLIDYKAYFPNTDEETSVNICSSEFKEYRMVFSDIGSTSEYAWYVTENPPVASDEPEQLHGTTSFLLAGSEAPSSTFYLTAVATDDPSESWAEKPKHSKVIQLVSTCSQPDDSGPIVGGGGLTQPVQENPDCYVIRINYVGGSYDEFGPYCDGVNN